MPAYAIRRGVVLAVALVLSAGAAAACGMGQPGPTGTAQPAESRAAPTGDASEPPATPSSEPTASPHSATPSPTPPPSWEATIFNRPEPPAGISAIAEGGPGLVAVGTTARAGAVWTLASGGEWEPVESVPELEDEDAFVTLLDVAAAPFGIVAVGITGRQATDTFSSVVWLSTDDGASWTEGQQLEGAEIVALVAGGPGMVAVGQVTSATERPAGVSIWTTADGVAWTEIQWTDELGRASMNDVVATESGFVAVGSTRDDPNHFPLNGGAWTSPDGASWTRVPHTAAFDDASMSSVTVAADRLVAVGSSSVEDVPPQPAVWTSADGSEWERIAVELGEGGMGHVAAADGSLVAAGYTGRAPDEMILALWTSTDGATWTEVPDVREEGSGGLQAALLFDGLVVAGGYAPAGEGRQPIVVTGPPPE